MENNVQCSKAFLFLLLVLLPNFCDAQELPLSHFGFRVEEKSGKKYGLFNWLEKDVPGPLEGVCKPTWDIFYFRVNGLGKIDTVRHEGNLREVVTKKILQNIHATEGHWQIPKETKPKEGSWYIFAYFDFGASHPTVSGCSEADQLLIETVINLSEALGRVGVYVNTEKAYPIVPSQNGGGYIKL